MKLSFMHKILSKFILGILLCLSFSSFAEDFGVDPSAVPAGKSGGDQIRSFVEKQQKSGELDKRMQEWRKGQLDKIYNPPDLGIKTNYKSTQEVFSPSFTIPQDYKDDQGRVVAKQGTVIEPLKLHALDSAYIFIDGRDQSQIQYALAQAKKYPTKIVFTAGSYVNEGNKYHQVFYYDYKAMIIGQLHRLYNINIDSVPAILFQKNGALFLTKGMSQ